MPNYVANIVTIVGSDEQIQKVVESIKSEYGVFDFNKIVPMPETFEKYDTTNHANGVQLRIGSPVGFEDDRIVTEELIEEFKRATKEQAEKYGVVGWYDWRHKFWGTKWNARDAQYEGDGRFIFDTAWSAPIPVLVALSRRFPDVTIHVAYADEDYGYNTGKGTIKAGMKDIFCPEGGSDEAMQIYFETHEGDEEYIHKGPDGKWTCEEE